MEDLLTQYVIYRHIGGHYCYNGICNNKYVRDTSVNTCWEFIIHQFLSKNTKTKHIVEREPSHEHWYSHVETLTTPMTAALLEFLWQWSPAIRLCYLYNHNTFALLFVALLPTVAVSPHFFDQQFSWCFLLVSFDSVTIDLVCINHA